MARLPKAVTRHDLDRLIVGSQVKLLQIAGSHAHALAIVEWWRSHYREDVTVMPPLKED
jgi:hypothetical protein